jgi:trimeric autotransporter adhesin
MKTIRFCMLASLMWLAALALAQITPSADSYIDTTRPSLHNGESAVLIVQETAYIAYIAFDLSSIPSGYTGSNVAKASLKLYVFAVHGAGSFNVDYVNGPWTESKINGNNAPPVGATITANVPLDRSQNLDYIVIDVTSAVQAWLNGTEPNYGLALVANSTFGAQFESKENTTQSHPPELDIVFTGASGGGIQGVLTGAGSGLTGGGTSGTLNLSLLTACGNGQVLAWNSGSGWTCTTVGGGGGGGTVSSVGLTAPSTDFLVTGSPITTSGTLGLGWLVAPDWNNTPGAIVKRDSAGNFSAGTITVTNGINIGANAFAFGSYTGQNVFLGFAGNTKTTANANTGVGYFALNASTSGGANTATGYEALQVNDTGSVNTATGSYALFDNAGGTHNTATGSGALYANVVGNTNTATGVASLYQNTSGSGNTASGYYSLFSNTTGYDNTALGYGADVGTGGLNYATAIGAYAAVGESNAVVLGCTQGVNGCPAPVNVGIGTTTPQYMLDVQGTGNFTGLVKFASGQAFPGTVAGVNTAAGSGLQGGGTNGTLNLSLVTSCATGQVLSWSGGNGWTCTNMSGGGGGTVTNVGLTAPSTDFIVTGSPVTSNGTLGLGWITAPDFNNTANAIVKRDSSGSFSAGTISAASGFNIGSNPFAFGSYDNNSAFFGFSGNAATTGAANTAAGYGALGANTTGFYNTASGAYALYRNTVGHDNTAIGLNALLNNASGIYNTASGSGALSTNSAGRENTANGFGALIQNTIGNFNTASGVDALITNTTGSSNTALGFAADVGSGDLTNATAIGASSQVTQSNSLVLGSIAGVNSATDSTRVGIGTTAPSNIFTIGKGSGHAIADGWDTYSSRRWKTNIHTLQGAMSKVEQLRGVSYDLRDSGKHEIGLIAEEVGTVVPEVVSWGKDRKDAQGVDYGRLTALLIEATKEQQALIQTQQQQIRAQQIQIRELTRQVREVRATLKAIGHTKPALHSAGTHAFLTHQ